MNKNLLSIAIILLAVAIVIVNLWEPNSSEEKKDVASEENGSTSSENVAVSDSSGVEIGKTAPDFELVTLKGESVKLSDYKGKKVILNFWATWCPPCKAEMPHMQKFYEENKEDGIEILAVNLTDIDSGKESIESFVKEYELTFEIPLDEEGVIGRQYQAFTIPTSYLIDTNGVISNKIVGPMDEEMMKSLTDEMN
ncbi:redoxin domain-containing protein [Paenisporosarcina quisquiliarum]|uniref:Redoxin domain-containing protein n=1 Tax=Paenisporosarcina quisquiliarum TaxID=365346 RepID=A0A9X3RDH7_9BACL|nr:redoxin domain-containing protein [Paenisporosarcina quisquiliarum]MCZ8537855.1 redoxin domain-containing protein [Paenisporosarcina quisquiliarum]